MESHLLQMRGLKLLRRKGSLGIGVASFTDAWIETGLFGSIGANKRVASFTDAWIETVKSGWLREWKESRIFYRCVD